MIKEYIEYIFLGILFTGLIAPFVIAMLYKFQLVTSHTLMQNKMNQEFIRIHGSKSGTPTMGGIMVFIGVLASSLLFIDNLNLKYVFLTGWISFFIYGLIDDLLTFFRRRSQKTRLFDNSLLWRIFKLITLIVLSFATIYLAREYLNVNSLNLFSLLEIKFSLAWILLGSIFFSLAVYGIEITDGADGLVTGNLLIVLLGLSLQYAEDFTQLHKLLAIAVGSLLVYLYFNIHPARVFMSSVGTFPLAFLVLFASIITDSLSYIIIAGIPFWLEVSSSFLQIVSIKFFKKKLFKLAPFHHHLEAKGWVETKVVQRFWLFGILCMLLGLWAS